MSNVVQRVKVLRCAQDDGGARTGVRAFTVRPTGVPSRSESRSFAALRTTGGAAMLTESTVAALAIGCLVLGLWLALAKR